MSMPVSAYDFVQNGIYYNIEGDHVSVTYSGNGVYTGSVSIPSQVTYDGVTYPVTAIGEWAFEGGEGMTYLYIPSSITSIGEYAFIDCGSNINVYINDLKAWCKVTFGNEHSSPLSSAKNFYLNHSVVTNLDIPQGVESIPNFAFYQCRSITFLNIPSSVKTIGSSAFEDCTSLKSLILNEGLVSLGGSSFEGCGGLSSIILPSSLTSIALNSFKNCTNLNTIFSKIQAPFAINENVFETYSTATLIIPSGTLSAYQSIESWNKFTNITDQGGSGGEVGQTIKIGNLNYKIGENNTMSVTKSVQNTRENNLGSIWIYPQVAYKGIIYTVTSIEYDAFNPGIGNYGITSVTIPSTITDIGFDAFSDQYGLKAVYIEDLEAWCKIRFANTLGNPLRYAHHLFLNGTEIRDLVIPSSVNSIGNYAFYGCNGLTSVTIPNSLTSIGKGTFGNCSGLTSITVESGNLYYDSRDDCNAIIEKSNNTLITGCKNTTIPNSVTSIGSYAFSGCSGLTTVTIPNSVTSIGDYAFSSCSGLTSVTIPNSVTSIGYMAFCGCSGLTTVHIADLEAWCKISFSSDCFSTGHHLYLNGEEIKDLTIPDNITFIGNYAFYKCSGLTSVTIPNGVTSIGGSAFEGCSGLTSVTIPNSVTSIGYRAFFGCSGLTSVAIPNSVTSIGSSAFSYCCGLTSIVIPNNVTSIDHYAFLGCSGLTSVTIPNSVTSIGDWAFSGCSGLTSIVSLNSNPPSVTYSSTFTNVDKNNCIVWVPKGSLSAYKGANVWKDFANIFELVEGDLNLDEVVDQNDMDALVGFVMGENPEGFYEGLADLNSDNKVNAADVVKMVDLVRASSGLGTVSQFVIENTVVSSLTCTLNNERSEAIQLTKCELYCNHNLVSYQSFSGASASVAAGGSKECTFNNLAKLNSSTGFTVCWYYTANGKNYVYRCPL